MRVAGVWPQKICLDPKIQHAVSEPYGLEMILAVAKEKGHDVKLFLPVVEREGVLQNTGEIEFVERIVDYKPDVVALSLYTSQYPIGTRIAAEIKKRHPRTIIVAGNRYPTFLNDRIEEPYDFFVLGEGEKIFEELLEKLQKKEQDYEHVKGIVARKNDRIICTGRRERVEDLDALPYALRFDVILNQVYRGISVPPLSSNPGYAIMEYSRACYNRCHFCDNYGFWGNSVIYRSTGKVIEEIYRLQKKGVKIFYFMDLNFTADLEKTKELCVGMIRERLNASWYCMSNISSVIGNEWILDLMKEAGCYKIAWGIESTDDCSLGMMGKSTKGVQLTNEQAQIVLEATLQRGFINQGFYIIGFPWETPESIAKDGEALKYMSIHQLNLGIFTPIPLSRFYNSVNGKKHDLISDLEKHDRNHLVYNHDSLTGESVKCLQEKLYHDFYMAPTYLERIKRTAGINPVLRKSFNDYFEYTGKDIKKI